MKRAVVFAHYDKDNIVDDYVLHYLKALQEHCSYIVLVSCNPIKNKDCLEGIANYIIDETHNEYDFGSYKRGFLYLNNKLEKFDELIFANDSCYGPLFSLNSVFKEMEKINCDFWGITKNNFGINNFSIKQTHIQSYFIVFRKNIFCSQLFYDFISTIRHIENKNDIIKNYEIGLSQTLYKAGYTSDCYINRYCNFENPSIYFWRPLIKKHKMPYLKCSILRHKNDYVTFSDGWENLIKNNSDYPIYLIQKNLERTSDKKLFAKTPTFLKKIYFGFIAVLPGGLKLLFIKFNKFLTSKS